MAHFKWSNFDETFLNAIISSDKNRPDNRPIYPTNDSDCLSSFMDNIAPVPNVQFVYDYREIIEKYFLHENPELILFATDAPEGENYLNILNNLVRHSMTESIADIYLKALFAVGQSEYDAMQYSTFTNVRTIDLESSIGDDEIPLYDFQEEAVQSLNKHFVEQDNNSGMLIMPTGSGKTRTAVAFLLKYMVPQGYQIIWLTHRHQLIDQSAEAFYNNAPSLKLYAPDLKQFKMVCVSGNHQSIKATEKDDNLMILSIQSTYRNLDYLKTVLGKKVIIVVDENHHIISPSWQKTVDYIRSKRKGTKLLGLTATPVRTNEKESRYLLKMFDNNIVYNISMGTLITKGILATPNFENIETGKNFEATINLNEEKYIRRWGELPESLVDKVAKSSERNNLIVKQYLDNKKRYGKTLIFALNSYHAMTLCREFRKHNVSCDFVYHHNGAERNTAVIEKFKRDQLDVLININILTEGSDVPDIQTVFLTRPTSSETLLIQMIGRGMRGIKANGTETVNIVDFNDKWEIFNKWLNPKWILSKQAEEPDEKISGKGKKPQFIPWGMIRDIYDSISYKSNGVFSNIAIPYGWYSLVHEDEEYNLIVFEDQYESYEQMIKDVKELRKSGTPTINGLKKCYFSNFILAPRDEDLGIFWQNLRDFTTRPAFFLFEDREKVDPKFVAEKIDSEHLDWIQYPTDIFNTYPLAKEFYQTVEEYRSRVFECKNRPNTPLLGYKTNELDISFLPFKIDNHHNLDQLVQEVVDEMFNGDTNNLGHISWTEKPMKSYYGIHQEPENITQINLILNSSQVPKEVIKYVIYHELLHRENMTHDYKFRLLEHKFPNYTEQERFLDYKMGQFHFTM